MIDKYKYQEEGWYHDYSNTGMTRDFLKLKILFDKYCSKILEKILSLGSTVELIFTDSLVTLGASLF